MPTTRLSAIPSDDNALGTYLKDRRARLDPATFGFSSSRRRTPGLRREEVAERADVSATWYTWLEQGRGGVPSADTLDRIAAALALTAVEREYLFLLAQHRPPEVRYRATEGVTPRLRKVLDALELSPALIKNSTWDVVAWNRAAAAVLTDYGALPPEERNILHLIFRNPHVRAHMPHWESVARSSVATFRADAARAGSTARVEALVSDLSGIPEFAAMWHDHEVLAHGEGTKHLLHPIAGAIAMDYSAFGVDGQPDLGMIVYTPATLIDRERIASLVEAWGKAER